MVKESTRRVKKMESYPEGVRPHRFKLVGIGNISICPNPACLHQTDTVVYYPPGAGVKAILECGQCGAPLGFETELFPTKRKLKRGKA